METGARIFTLPRSEAASLGRLRLSEELEVAETVQLIWLRIPDGTAASETILAGLPALSRRRLEPDLKLYEADHRLPDGKLPEHLRWTKLRDWLKVQAPQSTLAGTLPERVAVRIIRGGDMREADTLLLPISEFAGYISSAPEVRISRWRFAVNDQGKVIVVGSPIPPLPGQRFVSENQVAWPLGWRLEPHLSTAVIARCAGLNRGDLLLWDIDQTIHLIRNEQWLPVTRAAVRASSR